MKVTRTLGAGLTVEVESDTQIGLFEALADVDKSFDEVFGDKCCGKCGSEDIKFSVREVEKEVEEGGKKKKKKYTYYERVCRGCWAKLGFGQHQEGNTLFPRRKLDNGEFDKQNRGWVKWEGSSNKQSNNNTTRTTSSKAKLPDREEDETQAAGKDIPF